MRSTLSLSGKTIRNAVGLFVLLVDDGLGSSARMLTGSQQTFFNSMFKSKTANHPPLHPSSSSTTTTSSLMTTTTTTNLPARSMLRGNGR